MALNPLMTRDRVMIPARPDLTKAQKVAIWNAQNGLCPRCGKPVPLEGAGVQYDHDNPREISADDSLGNMAAMHTHCHSEKTRTEDVPRIAKAKRQEKLTRAKVRKPGGINAWRKFDGTIVRRGDR
jgi:5-methylcytosine-specific restriction protein A